MNITYELKSPLFSSISFIDSATHFIFYSSIVCDLIKEYSCWISAWSIPIISLVFLYIIFVYLFIQKGVQIKQQLP